MSLSGSQDQTWLFPVAGSCSTLRTIFLWVSGCSTTTMTFHLTLSIFLPYRVRHREPSESSCSHISVGQDMHSPNSFTSKRVQGLTSVAEWFPGDGVLPGKKEVPRKFFKNYYSKHNIKMVSGLYKSTLKRSRFRA